MRHSSHINKGYLVRMLKIETFIFNVFSENTYLVWDDITREALIIDPGCRDDQEGNEISLFISSNSLKLIYLLNTHCHIDHILGNAFIKETCNPKFLAGEEDLFLLELMTHQAERFGIEMKKSPLPDSFLKEGENLKFAGQEIEPIFTPGHSPGGYCLYFRQSGFCITGDVLFNEGIGRTDLWGGDYDTLINSIVKKLFFLPDETVIYAGHGSNSTIGHEKKDNPFIN